MIRTGGLQTRSDLILVLCHPCSDGLGRFLLRGIAVGGGGEEAVPGDVDGGGARGARPHDLAGQSSCAPAGTRAGAAASGRVRRRTGVDGYADCRSRAGQCAHDWAGAAALCRGGSEAALRPSRAGGFTRASWTARRRPAGGLACSGPPEGRRRWTLRLRAEPMVELEIVPDLSHETVRQTLQKRMRSSRICGESGASRPSTRPCSCSIWKTCWRPITGLTRSGRWSVWTSAASS